MKNKKLLIALSTVLAVSLMATGCGKEIEVKNGSKVTVSVKGEKITATEYYEKIKEDNIATLIDMIDHGFLDKNYKSDEEEKKDIEEQIKNIKNIYGDNEATYLSVIKQYFGVDSEEELKEMLSLEHKRTEAVKDYIRDNLKDSEIKKYYNENIYGEVSAKHILISSEAGKNATDEEKAEAEKKAKEEAEDIIKQLKDGKKFETLAKKYSDDTATASNGGNLGYFDLSTMVSEFSDAVKDLKVDEYTKEPVKTEYGYHIILKTGEKDKPKLSKVKDDIKDKLVSQKLDNDPTYYYEIIKKVREKYKISWNDDELKKAYDNYMDQLIEKAKSN